MFMFLRTQPTPLSFLGRLTRPMPLLSLFLPLPVGAHASETLVPPLCRPCRAARARRWRAVAAPPALSPTGWDQAPSPPSTCHVTPRTPIPPFLCFSWRRLKGAPPDAVAPVSSPPPLFPSQSTLSHPLPHLRPRQRPRLSRSSLLARPPLPPPRPRGEVRLPRFSAQILLRSSPPLGVWCCRSSSRPPPIAGAPPPPVNTVAPPLLRPHPSSHFLGEPTVPSFRRRPQGSLLVLPSRTLLPASH
jgi:hypothetical protein